MYFTKNGRHLGVATHLSSDAVRRLYPAVGLGGAGAKIRVNFGQEPFCYDVPLLGISNSETEAEKQARFERIRRVEEARNRHEEEAKARKEAQRAARAAQRSEMAQQVLQVCGPMIDNDERKALKALELNRYRVEVAISWLFDNPNALAEISRLVPDEEPDQTSSEANVPSNDSQQSSDGAQPKRLFTPKSSRARSTSSVEYSSAQYDESYSSSVCLWSSLEPLNHPQLNAASDQPSQAEIDWLHDIELSLRQRAVDAGTSRTVLNSLREGGVARENALLMVRDLIPHAPPPPAADSAIVTSKATLSPADIVPGVCVTSSDTSHHHCRGVGIVAKIDEKASLALVRFEDGDRGVASEWYIPMAALSRAQSRDAEAYASLKGVETENVAMEMFSVHARKAVLLLVQHC